MDHTGEHLDAGVLLDHPHIRGEIADPDEDVAVRILAGCLLEHGFDRGIDTVAQPGAVAQLGRDIGRTELRGLAPATGDRLQERGMQKVPDLPEHGDRHRRQQVGVLPVGVEVVRRGTVALVDVLAQVGAIPAELDQPIVFLLGECPRRVQEAVGRHLAPHLVAGPREEPHARGGLDETVVDAVVLRLQHQLVVVLHHVHVPGQTVLEFGPGVVDLSIESVVGHHASLDESWVSP
ncbi:hypothetical protein E143388_02758 [Rhodococcus opacus]|nr:hypothetical protein E143388_02758 [Rhodococcus opacus]